MASKYQNNMTFLCRRCPLSDGSFADRNLFDRGWEDTQAKSPAQFRCTRAKGVFRVLGLQVYVAEDIEKIRPSVIPLN